MRELSDKARKWLALVAIAGSVPLDVVRDADAEAAVAELEEAGLVVVLKGALEVVPGALEARGVALGVGGLPVLPVESRLPVARAGNGRHPLDASGQREPGMGLVAVLGGAARQPAGGQSWKQFARAYGAWVLVALLALGGGVGFLELRELRAENAEHRQVLSELRSAFAAQQAATKAAVEKGTELSAERETVLAGLVKRVERFEARSEARDANLADLERQTEAMIRVVEAALREGK